MRDWSIHRLIGLLFRQTLVYDRIMTFLLMDWVCLILDGDDLSIGRVGGGEVSFVVVQSTMWFEVSSWWWRRQFCIVIKIITCVPIPVVVWDYPKNKNNKLAIHPWNYVRFPLRTVPYKIVVRIWSTRCNDRPARRTGVQGMELLSSIDCLLWL